MIKNKLTKTLAFTLATISILSLGSNTFADYNIESYSKDSKFIEESSNTRGYGNWITFDKDKKYSGRPGAHTSSSGVYGTQTTRSTSSVPANRIGAHCNLYRASDGAIVRTADWAYNTSTVSTFTNSTSKYNAKGTYYAQGTSKGFLSNNTYETKWCGQSTIAQIKSLNISSEDKQERIKLYEDKQMVKAIGENDIEGYILLEDLYDEENQPKNSSEAKIYMSKRARSLKQYRMIPLYDTDGQTVIGEYRIDFGIVSEQ